MSKLIDLINGLDLSSFITAQAYNYADGEKAMLLCRAVGVNLNITHKVEMLPHYNIYPKEFLIVGPSPLTAYETIFWCMACFACSNPGTLTQDAFPYISLVMEAYGFDNVNQYIQSAKSFLQIGS